VALLEISADRRNAEVDQLAVEHQLGGCQQVLFTPTGIAPGGTLRLWSLLLQTCSTPRGKATSA
jgi:hypothetical protein